MAAPLFSVKLQAHLMKQCSIFDLYGIEMRANTTAAASRKITTVAKLDVAIKPFQGRLLDSSSINQPIYRPDFLGARSRARKPVAHWT